MRLLALRSRQQALLERQLDCSQFPRAFAHIQHPQVETRDQSGWQRAEVDPAAAREPLQSTFRNKAFDLFTQLRVGGEFGGAGEY
jgi:hypothetical protein